MTGSAPALVEFIRAEIAARGPVTFAWFMEQALYHPTHGYYSSGRARIGREGDYFTNVSVGPLFGRLMTAQFAEMWDAMGRPDEFTIVEQGAHGGEFAHDVLSAARARYPEFFNAIRYDIVEPFEKLKQRQAAALHPPVTQSEHTGPADPTRNSDTAPSPPSSRAERSEVEGSPGVTSEAAPRDSSTALGMTREETLHGALGAKIRWHNSLDAMPPFRGIHFSNELLDAMPVHLIRWTGTEWLERHVADRDGDFAFVDLPLSDDRLAERLGAIVPALPPGYETEVNLAVTDWIEALSEKLHEGFVMAVDYGWPRDEYYAARRATGTLRGYAKHRVVPSPLTRIGEADLTVHVEWTSLAKEAQKHGLTVSGWVDQHHFITGLIAGPLREKFAASAKPKTARALQTLLHPSQLGMKFQYLVLAKGARAAAANLSGLRFARASSSQLNDH